MPGVECRPLFEIVDEGETAQISNYRRHDFSTRLYEAPAGELLLLITAK
jgi:hypothetical protein